ncbi:MAG TPA: RAMP superfamily CRISPR-associated protein [Anaerolineae bacterium]|nr:RAMP superfamily CRISPR-associated protein [Anaerolineae bacterium]HRT31376.1 RAMP superfamily CRISPR-associated protein [Anaerolineae bacterium]HXK42091.1 RAMP superfamily CRISPR-associated protein [Anaerolineae bacterium]
MNDTLIITGALKTRTALHLGAGKDIAEFDALLRRTAAGDMFIPGSALAGALRAIATRLAPRIGSKVCQALEAKTFKEPCGCMVCHLFGDVNPQEKDTEAAGGRASRLWVYDAALKSDTNTWIRDGVGIDRASGAAARQGAVKFDLEVLPAEAVFDLHLELEDADENDQRLLAAILAEWQAGRGAVGGRVARGLGALALERLQVQAQNLDTAAALMGFLRGESGAGLQPARKEDQDWLTGWVQAARQELVPVKANPFVAHSWIEVELTLQATGPLLVNDPTQAGRAGFDHAPLVEGRPVLPGSSLRGVLRSHAERIARTLATEQAVHGGEFLATCPACSPVARPRGAEDLPLECCDALLKRHESPNADEKIRRDPDREVDAEHELCLACQLFGSPRQGSRLIIEDAPLQVGTEPVYKVQDFLAIDRFTGGGRDGAKFDAAALWRPTFTVRLRLENPWDWEVGWLALTLRDLAEGWLTVGFGAAKGFGQVWVPQWTATIGFLQPQDFPLVSPSGAEDASAFDATALLNAAIIQPEPPSLYQLATVAGTLEQPAEQQHWRWQVSPAGDWKPLVQAWVNTFNTRLQRFERSVKTLPLLQVDSYFDGGLVERLYPKASAAWEARHE